MQNKFLTPIIRTFSKHIIKIYKDDGFLFNVSYDKVNNLALEKLNS